MGLLGTLNVGTTGLRASQAGLATVGQNIANVDTEGYSRQRVDFEALPATQVGPGPSYLGQGTRLVDVTRAHDRYLERQSQRDQTALGFYQGRGNTLDAVERLFTESGEPTLGPALDGFFDATRTLSQEPDDPARRQSFLESAEGVASAFRTLDADLRSTQRGIDDDLKDRVGKADQLGKTIAALNAQIVASESANGEQANDLRDKRDQAIRDLSKLVDTNVLEQKDGSVTVEIAGQWTLVQGDVAAGLETLPDANNQGLLDVVYVDVSGKQTVITGDLTQGEIGGLLDVRDNVLGTDLTDLDQLAFQFVSVVNAQHRAGFGLDGNDNRDLFVQPAVAAFAAANVAVDPAVQGNPDFVAAASAAANTPGDNTNLLAIAALQDQPQAALGNVSFSRRNAELVSGVGQAAADNRTKQDVQEARAQQSETLRESVAGVNLDDEMIDLNKFQKHFEANTRVITAVSQLLDAVMELVK